MRFQISFQPVLREKYRVTDEDLRNTFLYTDNVRKDLIVDRDGALHAVQPRY